MTSIIMVIIAMSWMCPSSLPSMEMSARQLRDNVENAFNKLDNNQDGILTREEFVNSCLLVRGVIHKSRNYVGGKKLHSWKFL